MMTNADTRRGERSPLPGLAAAGALLMLLPLAGCDLNRIFDIPDPDVADPSIFDDPLTLPQQRAAALLDMADAYIGYPSSSGEDGQIAFSGALADELIVSGTFPTRQQVDQRRVQVDNSTNQLVFRRLQRARVTAERTAGSFSRLGEGRRGHAESLSLAGFTYVMFAENYCSGVPFTTLLDDDTFDYGERETTRQVLERALARFTAAHQVAEANPAELPAAAQAVDLNIARLGLARTHLNLGNWDDAYDWASQVDGDFWYEIEQSGNSTRQNNGVWDLVNSVKRWSMVDATLGVNQSPLGMQYLTDPRTPPGPVTIGFRNTRFNVAQMRYPRRDTNVPLATGLEARLIMAEVALQRRNYVEFLAIHNDLRTNPPSTADAFFDYSPMAPLSAEDIDGLSHRELQELHFRERGYWLFLTSHRLGDLRRLVGKDEYGFAEEAVFNTGTYFQGIPRPGFNAAVGTFGSDMNLPLPVDEQNNPAAGGTQMECLNRDAWNLG
jgi:starch-binding outer membrane protein, SusD/RagB family